MFAATASSGILLPVANNILAALNSTKVELMLYIVVRQQYTALLEAVVTVGNSKSIVNPIVNWIYIDLRCPSRYKVAL